MTTNPKRSQLTMNQKYYQRVIRNGMENYAFPVYMTKKINMMLHKYMKSKKYQNTHDGDLGDCCKK